MSLNGVKSRKRPRNVLSQKSKTQRPGLLTHQRHRLEEDEAGVVTTVPVVVEAEAQTVVEEYLVGAERDQRRVGRAIHAQRRVFQRLRRILAGARRQRRMG